VSTPQFDTDNLDGVRAAIEAMKSPVAVAVVAVEPVEPVAQQIPQPDQNGEFATPLDGALWMAATYGIPQTPLRGKIPFLPAWQKNASADPTQLRQWLVQYPGCNFGSVAAGMHFIFEADSLAVRERFKKQGHDFTSSLIIESSPGKGHRYYLSAPGVENIGQNKGEDFSIRANGEQCVTPGGLHPVTGKQYRVVVNNGPLTQPTAEEILFWKSERVEKKTGHAELDDKSPIVTGSRNSTMASLLGKARQVLAMDREQLYEYGRSVNQQRCVPPLSDTEVRTIADSIGKYEVKATPPVIVGGQAIGQPQTEQIEIPKLKKVPYPVFPSWTMFGTSIYEGFVKPVCDQNSRIPYFMFLPAAALMMNYLGMKIKVKNQNHIPSFFMVLIGEKGRAIKSSSVEDAIEYLHVAGVMDHARPGTLNAEGRSLVWTVGSPEGLGLEMQRTNCKNAVLFYDELSGLTSKIEIDSSSLKSSLLSLYESGQFSNTIKSRKETYSIQPRTYCASLIACTTDEYFEDQWSRLTGKSTGLDDRFMFLLQPQKLDDLKPKTDVNTVLGSIETKKRIDKAVLQGEYIIDDMTSLEAKIGVLGNRTEIRAEKWALYFAVDLGRESIDGECIERGLAIAEYEKAVKKYLGSPEAETKIAAAQIKYRRTLEQKFDGRAKTRDMERAMNSSRYGTEGWFRIYDGLKRAGIIAELGGGTPGTLKEVVVREPLDD
jgi:bifunctional DNA primase/polymerase-like protein/primase-like protein